MPSSTFLIAVSNGLAKLKCSREDCNNQATNSWDDIPYCWMHFIIEERMNT